MDFNNNEGISITKNLESLSYDRILNSVRLILNKNFPEEAERRTIQTSRSRLSFCCPYCGDGKSPRKKRGNLYLDTLTYKCYNGGCGIFKTFPTLLTDFGFGGEITKEEAFNLNQAFEEIRSQKRTRNTIDYFIAENYKDVLIPRKYFKEKLGLTECTGEISNYLKNRNQIVDETFLWDWKKRNLYILNLSGSGENILGLQVRNMKKGAGSKYYTYKLSGIYLTLLNENKEEIIKKAEEVDPISHIFGFSSVNLDAMVTAFEGPLDARLFSNSIGLCSINNPFPFDIKNRRFFYDYDEAGLQKSRELLLEGEKVFLWTKYIQENGLPNRKKWDLNDVVDYARKTGKKIQRFENYFSDDKWSITEI